MLRSACVNGLLFLLFISMEGGVAWAAAAVTGIRVEPTQGGERLVLESPVKLNHTALLRLSAPDRIVIDFPTLASANVALSSGGSAIVSGVRFGQFDSQTSRIVLDLTQPVEEVTAGADASGKGGLVIEMRVASGSASPAMQTAAPVAASSYDSAQDEKPLIVIDAGHGGQDPGAIGAHKTHEKDVTLAMARALRQALLRTGRYRVALTRDSDVFIMLGERVNIARKLKADMFISLHADSNPRPDAKGFSVYTISDTASDEEAAALAARENAVDDLSGMDLGDVDKDVADILIDLAARETKTKSAQLADIVVEALHPKITKLTKPHRYAGFRVLKAPDIPSVLVELGFLTNATDEKLLASPEYRELVMASLARGIDAYYVTIKRR